MPGWNYFKIQGQDPPALAVQVHMHGLAVHAGRPCTRHKLLCMPAARTPTRAYEGATYAERLAKGDAKETIRKLMKSMGKQ